MARALACLSGGSINMAMRMRCLFELSSFYSIVAIILLWLLPELDCLYCQTRSGLQELFGPCGEITRISIPPDRENNCLKGYVFI